MSEKAIVCDYCMKPAVLASGAKIYPHRPDLARKWFYQCEPCDAYVGCHPSSTRPLGRLANPVLRSAKRRAHAAFDPLWKNRHLSRTSAYRLLSELMNLKPADTHIGMFNEEQCQKVVEICRGVQQSYDKKQSEMEIRS